MVYRRWWCQPWNSSWESWRDLGYPHFWIQFLFREFGCKGQTNSKWFFQANVSSKKTNEQIQLYYLLTCFRSFFGRKWRHQKDISELTDHWPLWLFQLQITPNPPIAHQLFAIGFWSIWSPWFSSPFSSMDQNFSKLELDIQTAQFLLLLQMRP